ncbi:MAG: uroporphyrinogen decarboxylase/cobalamine-independent methonine synthase family protein [Candidatus Humimicrobiaceae bacterium]
MIKNNIDFNIDINEIEKRKQRIRDIWQYKKVDHIPLGLYVVDNREKFTRKEIEQEKEKNLRFDLNNVKKSLTLLTDDYIPFVKPEVGCATIPSILGAKIYFTSAFDNFSTVKGPLIKDIDQLENLYIPEEDEEIKSRGLMPLNLEKIKYYREVVGDRINYTGFDIGGVLCGSIDIIDTSLFYMSLLTDKEKIIKFLDKLSNLYIRVQKILISKFGGLSNMMNIDWEPSWYPEGHKGYLSDDPCANLSIPLFEVFSKPYDKKIYDAFGYGGFHNCGPHPCAGAYIDYKKDKVKAINCSLKCTYNELDRFISVFKDTETVLYFLFEEEYYTAPKSIKLYEEIIKKGIDNNIACIPFYAIDNSIYSNDEIKDIFESFLKLSKKYAGHLKLK